MVKRLCQWVACTLARNPRWMSGRSALKAPPDRGCVAGSGDPWPLRTWTPTALLQCLFCKVHNSIADVQRGASLHQAAWSFRWRPMISGPLAWTAAPLMQQTSIVVWGSDGPHVCSRFPTDVLLVLLVLLQVKLGIRRPTAA